MSVNTDVIARNTGRNHCFGGGMHLWRQCTAVGVTQHHPARPCIISGFGSFQCVFGVGFVAVKEMLAIKQRFTALVYDMFDRSRDILDIFAQRNTQSGCHMKIMGLADQTNRRRVGV